MALIWINGRNNVYAIGCKKKKKEREKKKAQTHSGGNEGRTEMWKSIYDTQKREWIIAKIIRFAFCVRVVFFRLHFRL